MTECSIFCGQICKTLLNWSKPVIGEFIRFWVSLCKNEVFMFVQKINLAENSKIYDTTQIKSLIFLGYLTNIYKTEQLNIDRIWFTYLFRCQFLSIFTREVTFLKLKLETIQKCTPFF